ncbi:unnamed protein product, partial [Meganyctiphanes norvegica]
GTQAAYCHRMLRATLLLALLGTVLAGGDSFTKKYAYSKIMSNCWGEDVYLAWTKQIHKFAMECKEEIHEMVKHGKEPEVQVNEAPLASFFDTFRSSSAGQPQYIPIPVYHQYSQAANPFVQFHRQKREAMYSSELLKKMMKKIKVKVGTMKCVLKQMGYIDENKNLNTRIIKSETERGAAALHPALKADLIGRVDKCFEFSKCVEDKDSPLPIELQRIMAYLKCDKKKRVAICMKADLRKYMSEFDLSAFGMEYDEDDKIEKLLHVLWGADPGTDPLDLLA